MTRPRERAYALAAVVAVQVALGVALLTGLRVQVGRSAEAVQQLVQIVLPKPPPRVQPPPPPSEKKLASKPEAAPKAEPAPPGGSPGPKPAHAAPSVAPIVSIRPTAPPSGGGTGSGPALGAGAGGGAGGNGYGAGGGGTELEQIAGEITPRDYPRRLGNAGVGGRVGLLFTVGVNGRVTQCSVTSSSGIPELDALTCRLIMQRFVFRPATDRYGRPVADRVEGEHIWEVGGRY